VKRTILFATEYWKPFSPGGAEWTNAAWAAALARRGHRVVVVTPNYGAEPREERDGVIVVRPPFPVRMTPGPGETRWLVNRNPLFHVWFDRWTRRIAATHGADLVHAQNNAACVGARRAARALGVPFTITIRDVGLLCPVGAPLSESWTTFDCSARQYVTRCVPYFLEHYASGDGPLRRAWHWASLLATWVDHMAQRRALATADLVIGVSRGILDVFPPGLVDRSRTRVVHSPAPDVPHGTEDPDRVRKRLGIGPGPLVLYAGKRSLGKGTDVLVAAMDSIRAAVPGVRFVFAGKGELAPPARADVHVLGSVPQPTLFALYAAADVVVIPSVWPEPLSRVLIEAMHFGRAVVATSVGGSPELLDDDVTGRLVEPRDHAALARAVATLLRDPARRARLGAGAARFIAMELDEDRLVSALLDAYESVLARRAEAPRRPA
jgi:glycosyltransferase involved in cell wall biosynthesis